MSEEDLCDSLDSSFGSLSLPFKSTLSDDQYLEDGPVFRATIQQLENRTGALKQSLKRIIKTASSLLETRQYLARVNQNYMDALRNAPYLEPLMSHYLNAASVTIEEEQKSIDTSLQAQLIDTLRNIYEHDIKMVENKRRQFEDVSKEYYASLAKYLKASKKKDTDTTNQQARKHKFDLARFDYFAFLVDLHGGKKENEILFSIADHSIRSFEFYETVATKLTRDKSGLDELITLMATTSREQEQSNLERAAKRKELETLCSSTNINNKNMDNNGEEEGTTEEVEIEAVEEDRFKGIRDLEQQHRDGTDAGRKKEGFLFATAKPAKSLGFDVSSSSSVPWHKYWCVLSNGQLHEYSNWKRQLESHIEPINLRFATVREARNVERRFCFEVITPYMRRVYQATSPEETSSWIATIQNAIESLLNGTSSTARLQEAPEPSKSTLKHNRKLSGIKSSLVSAGKSSKRQSNTPAEGAELLVSASAPNERFRWSGFSFGNAHGNSKVTGANNGHFLFSALPDANTKLISVLREEPSNHYCVDCGATNPDWCSLNLGVLLCIECSGIHRSLGTHVSKIRSLTLDSTSYTPDIIELLRSIGNARSNAIWDPRNDGSSPSASDSRNIKLAYIQQKYVGRAYVTRDNNAELPSQLLFNAIDTDNIPAGLQAIALGASPNATRPYDFNSPRISLMAPMYTPFLMDLESGSNKIETLDSSDEHYVVRYALHYALLHGRDISEKDILEEPNNNSSSYFREDDDHRKVVFPMAEFLLQNGADTGIIDPETGHTVSDLVSLGSVLGDGAIAYINMKNTARGQSTITRSNMLFSPQSSISTNTIPEKST